MNIMIISTMGENGINVIYNTPCHDISFNQLKNFIEHNTYPSQVKLFELNENVYREHKVKLLIKTCIYSISNLPDRDKLFAIHFLSSNKIADVSIIIKNIASILSEYKICNFSIIDLQNILDTIILKNNILKINNKEIPLTLKNIESGGFLWN